MPECAPFRTRRPPRLRLAILLGVIVAVSKATPDGQTERLAAPTLIVLTLFIFVNYLDRYALSVLLEPIKQELALSDTQIGLLTGAAFALLYSTIAIPVARIAEHGNRTYVMCAAITLWSAGTALCGLAGGFAGLFVARMIVGSAESGALAPAHAMIGDRYAIEGRGTALAIFSTGGALGTALAPLVGGYLEGLFGWRGAFFVMGAIGIPVAVALVLIVHDAPHSGARWVPPPPSLKVTLRRLWRRRSFALLVPAMTFLGLGDYSLFLWLPSYLSRMFSSTPAEVGAQLTIFQGLPLFAGTFFGGLVADRLVRRDRRWLVRLPAIACAVVAGGSGLLLFATSSSIALMLLILPSLACGLYLAPSYAAIQALAGSRSRATATATLTFAVNLVGLGLGPVLIGGTSDLLKAWAGSDSLRYAFFIIPPLYFCAAALFLIAARSISRDIAEAETE
jgi:predicted MFS family arabinose efflux permease